MLIKQISKSVKAEELMKSNSEIFIVKKMIATLTNAWGSNESLHDVWSRRHTAMLEEAKNDNAENPRVYIVEAQDKYFTPNNLGEQRRSKSSF
jgi:hypothetical protein